MRHFDIDYSPRNESVVLETSLKMNSISVVIGRDTTLAFESRGTALDKRQNRAELVWTRPCVERLPNQSPATSNVGIFLEV
jgi:hypothetical protein